MRILSYHPDEYTHFEKHVFGHATSLIGRIFMTPYSENFPSATSYQICPKFEENPPSGC